MIIKTTLGVGHTVSKGDISKFQIWKFQIKNILRLRQYRKIRTFSLKSILLVLIKKIVL